MEQHSGGKSSKKFRVESSVETKKIKQIIFESAISAYNEAPFRPDMAIYFFFSLFIRTFEVTAISVVNFFVACFASEILKD